MSNLEHQRFQSLSPVSPYSTSQRLTLTVRFSSIPASNFFLLPLEIRLMIYELAYDHKQSTSRWYITPPIKDGSRRRHKALIDQHTSRLALAHTCRQLYLEAAPLCYQNRTLEFRNAQWMSKFIETIGPNNTIQGIGNQLLHWVRYIKFRVYNEALVRQAARFPNLVCFNTGRFKPSPGWKERMQVLLDECMYDFSCCEVPWATDRWRNSITSAVCYKNPERLGRKMGISPPVLFHNRWQLKRCLIADCDARGIYVDLDPNWKKV